MHSLGELAVRFGLELHGNPELSVAGVATLAQATEGTLSFYANSRYKRHLASTRATAVVLSPGDLALCPVAALVAPNPYLAYARIVTLMQPAAPMAAGIHPSAVVAATAEVAASASVGALCVIEAGAVIGERCSIGAGCTIQAGARVGNDTQLMPRVTLYQAVRIGERCLLHSGAVIGADGFGFANENGAYIKIPQTGGVLIGDDVEIGANTTVDRGAMADTVIEEGVKIDNQVQIGHNCRIGAYTVIAGCTGIAGSTTVGRHCIIGGAVGIGGHLTLADRITVAGKSSVTKSLTKAGVYSGTFPAIESADWNRNAALMRNLDKMRARLKKIETQLETELEAALNPPR